MTSQVYFVVGCAVCLNNEIRLLSGHKLTISAPGEMGPPMKRPHKDPVVQDYPLLDPHW